MKDNKNNTMYDISIWNRTHTGKEFTEWKYICSMSTLDIQKIKNYMFDWGQTRIKISAYKNGLINFAVTIFDNNFNEDLSLDEFLGVIRCCKYGLGLFGLEVTDESENEGQEDSV